MDWLRKFAPFANGVPSHDCIANVVSRLSPKGFQACFRSWTQAVSEATKDEVGMVERHCSTGETQTVERRYFINSIRAEAKGFAHAVRDHWGVENSLYWRLDVVFGEDASRIRKGNAPAIMTSIRHLCMNLFEQEPSSLRPSKKRRKAAWNDDYRANVVFG